MERAFRGVFTRSEVTCWVGGSVDRQFSLIKRALAAKEVARIRRGLYCLAARYLPHKIDPLAVAQRIYGPSYIGLETALSWHGLIPEAVYAITSVSASRSSVFDTPIGQFSFTRVPQETFYTDVARVETGEGGAFMVASPLKALADYVYVHKKNWTSVRPVFASLRVDEELLAHLNRESFDRLRENTTSNRVCRFLDGLEKDLLS